jgi:hypothetical protein
MYLIPPLAERKSIANKSLVAVSDRIIEKVATVIVECLSVWHWQTLHWTPLRQLHLKTLKVSLVGRLPLEPNRSRL